MKLILFLLLFCAPLFSFSQNKEKSVFSTNEDSLKKLGPLILKGETDETKYAANDKFLALLEKALKEPGSFDYPFDSLITIARLTAPDNTFRMFNWHLPKEDGTFEYFGFIQTNFKKNKDIFPLLDKSEELKAAGNKMLDNNNWFGAHYYKIGLPKKSQNYILLGWDGNDMATNRKIIETLSFDSKGRPRFGGNLQDENKRMQKRIIFTYAEDAAMSLKYYDEENKIVFDHLSPKDPLLKGQYQFYGPDLSFDAYEFKKGRWDYIKDFDARNRPEKKRAYNNPK